MVRVFDDWRSLIHLLLGFTASLDVAVSIAVSLSYAVYQYIDEDNVEEKKGDYVEYILGVLIGFFVKKIFGL